MIDEPLEFAIDGITRAMPLVIVPRQLAACEIALDRVELAVFWRAIALSSAAWLAAVAWPQ